MTCRSIYTVILIHIIASASFGEFEQEQIPDSLIPVVCKLRCVATDQDTPFEKEPVYKGKKQVYGSLMTASLPCHQICPNKFVAFDSKGDGNLDSIIIDANNNLDLTDDQVIRVGVPARLKITDVIDRKILAGSYREKEKSFLVAPAEWYSGSLTLSGNKLKAAIIDLNEEGVNLDSSDFLVYDRNHDSQIQIVSDPSSVEGALAIRDPLIIKGKVWNVALGDKRSEIILSPFKGDVGAVTIKTVVPGHIKVYTSMLETSREAGDNDRYKIFIEEGGEQSQIPVGTYKDTLARITVGTDKRQTAQLVYSITKPLAITKDQLLEVPLSGIGKLTVMVQRVKDSLRIGCKIEPSGGFVLMGVFLRKKNGKVVTPSLPHVVVKSKSTNKILGEGRMQYDWGGECGYWFDIPEEFGPDEEINITATLDTTRDALGKFTVTKTYKVSK